MASTSKKYTALPDLDTAPDVYETPEIPSVSNDIEDARPASAGSSSYKDFSDDDETTSGVDHHKIHPNRAREQFQPARVDARGVDFSDRVGNVNKKSYRTFSRRSRRRQDKNGTMIEEYGDFSDEEDETLERKIARLKREVEEVRLEAENREESKEAEDAVHDEDIAQLSELLRQLQSKKPPQPQAPQSQLTTNGVHETREAAVTTQLNTSSTPIPLGAAQSDSATTAQVLSKAAALESRLASLETLLGIPGATSLQHQTQQSAPNKPVLTTLSLLENNLATLTSATIATQLDPVSAQIKQLTADSERVQAVQQQQRAASSGSAPGAPPPAPEADSRISSLHAALPTIESLSPLLPPVLERLRTLRMLHADAATAEEELRRVEKRQAAMDEEMATWKEGLEKVEAAVKKAEETGEGNREVVERWVKELEGRMQRMGGGLS